MKRTTLCYIEKDGCYLMLRRAASKKDGSAGKYLGVGGKIEQGETVEQCLLRETREETGLSLVSFRQRGVVSFFSDLYEDETMYLYTAIQAEGDPPAVCDEGELSYIPKEKVPSLPLWEGDRIFLRPACKGRPLFYPVPLLRRRAPDTRPSERRTAPGRGVGRRPYLQKRKAKNP